MFNLAKQTHLKILAGAAFSLGLVIASSASAATLVAEYQFGNAGNLGADTSGYNNNATTVTNITQVSGPKAGMSAGHFDQSSQFDIVGGLNGYSAVPGFSFAAWVYVDGTNGDWNGVISQDFGDCCTNRLLLQNGATPFTNIGAHNDQFMGTALPTRVWHQLVLTAENSGGDAIGRLYVDGVEVSTGSRTVSALPNLTGVSTYLGSGEFGGPYRLSGDLADVRIYQGALTSGEVSSLYAATPSGAVPEPAAWAMMLVGVGAIGGALRTRRRYALATA